MRRRACSPSTSGSSAPAQSSIETNTFGANRPKLRERYLEDDVRAINEAAAKIAREAREVSGRDVFIAGAIGPLGDAREVGDDESRDARGAGGLLEGRESISSPSRRSSTSRLAMAIDAVRSVSSLPIVALLTFDEDALTLSGIGAEEAAEQLSRTRRGRARREPQRRAAGRASRDRADGSAACRWP